MCPKTIKGTWKGSTYNKDSILHLFSEPKEPDASRSTFHKQSHILVTLRKVGTSKMGIRGQGLTGEEDRKTKAFGKKQYHPLPNPTGSFPPLAYPVAAKCHRWYGFCCLIIYHTVHHTEKDSSAGKASTTPAKYAGYILKR